MDHFLETLSLDSWENAIPREIQEKAILALESGKVLFLPNLSFSLSQDENPLLSPEIVDPKSKNISYDIKTDRVGGSRCSENMEAKLRLMIQRYALNSRSLFEHLFPRYVEHANQARTSFRPVEASGRHLSPRKDDTRLHVDSFPANPVKGKRILRIFTNVNPHGKPRVWRLGEPFPDVVQKMGPKTKKPLPGSSFFLQLFRLTKSTRSLYDHYMLQIHDAMKMDNSYQNSAPQKEVHFPPGSSWIVYSDQVSHAAMSGQHLFEQTFYLPTTAMLNPTTTPQHVLEKYFQKALV